MCQVDAGTLLYCTRCAISILCNIEIIIIIKRLL